MSTTYAQRQSPAQKKDAPTASSVLDNSPQSEGLQRKADMANNAAQREEAQRPNNTGMPDNLKSGIESLSGFSMDDVRVHYNSSKPATVQALAYTQGTDIHVAPGQEKCLPHEAWHVAQQMAGRVSPTTNINGMPVNDNAALEHEADVMGAKAMQMKAEESKTVQRATMWNGVAQRVELNEYYYHICQGGIIGEIDPMHALNTGIRTTRGDDLGPGFYMGDYNCLKAYYDATYKGNEVLFIYYIKKDLLENTDITDFRKGIEKVPPEKGAVVQPDRLFQIAMELGMAKGVKPLDLLLAPEKQNLDAFNEYVDTHYPKEAGAIKNFFKDAKDKDIWMGYLNDINKEAEGKYQYVQWKESDKDVKPIQIAIRKKEKIKKFLETMRTKNQIYFTKRILGIEPTTEEGKELKEKLKSLFVGYK